MEMKTECIAILDSIIKQQEIICNIYVKLNGKEDQNTKKAFERLNKYKSAKEKYINN